MVIVTYQLIRIQCQLLYRSLNFFYTVFQLRHSIKSFGKFEK